MIAYKFLGAGRVAPFSGAVWPAPSDDPARDWLESDGPVSPCVAGVHACRALQLPYWIADDLWEVELDGGVVEAELKIVAARGRLARRVSAWAEGVGDGFAAHCLRRVAHHAAAELAAAGLGAEAARVAEAADATVPEMVDAAAAAAAASATGKRRVRHAGHLAQYVVDAADWLSDPAGVAYAAAHAANSRTAPEDEVDPFARERDHQARWLAQALGLEDTIEAA